ncbi:MAG: type II toxin-antitoxin system VapC family toxin [Leptospiraceae bacterium]|nr:type II toxin-antitoxin system VapC family toxin [Leptospiraceae bacterium]
MKFILDTNICIHFLNGTSTKVKNNFLKYHNEICICSPVIAELYYGAFKSYHKNENVKRIDDFVDKITSLSFNNKAAYHYGLIRTQLEKGGTPIGPNDLIIAAIAVANNLTLVTNNIKEFSRIENLSLEDWIK